MTNYQFAAHINVLVDQELTPERHQDLERRLHAALEWSTAEEALTCALGDVEEVIIRLTG